MIALLVVVAIGLIIVRGITRRRMMQRAFEEAGPPASRPRTMVALAFLFVLAGTLLLRITDSWWWALLWVPGIAFAVVAQRTREPTTTDD